MAGMIIFLTNPIIPMRQRLIEKAKLLPEPESYFRGREIGGGFRYGGGTCVKFDDAVGQPHGGQILLDLFDGHIFPLFRQFHQPLN